MSHADAQPLIVPAKLRDISIESNGERAREWLDRLPGLVAEQLARWSCVVDGAALSGYAGLVVPVRRVDGSRVMLKVSSPLGDLQFEATTLATWDGRGAVRLLERDDENFAMLLERLHPESLTTVADSDEAMTIIGRLARRLAVPAPPEPPRMRPHIERWANELPAMSAAAGYPYPQGVVDAAVATCVELGPEQPETMQHGDLNQTNVLRGTREPWLAIDPLGCVGEVAFECLTHLRDRWSELKKLPDPDRALRRRIEIFADAAEVEVVRAVRWTHTRAVIASLREREGGEEPHEVHDWLATTLSPPGGR